ncbi:MAG: hypothetical protein AAGB11_16785 [Pseudomonadota bacterium]
MIVNNVTLVFLPSGAPAGEATTAPNQQIYLDLTPGTMTRVQSNAQGRIVGVSPPGSQIGLDDSRTYQVVVSPSAITPPPSASQGVATRVVGGRLSVAPKIAVKINRSAGSNANLACVLQIGGTSTNLSTTASGLLISNDPTPGEVLVRCDTLLLRTAGGTNPSVTLSTTPQTPVRGSSATIEPNVPPATKGFKVTKWEYDISHTNPGNGSAQTANVVRPGNEDASNFDRHWRGEFCASGTARMHFVAGAVVRAAGNGAVNVTLNAVDPVEVTLDVSVDARTGNSWTTTLHENPVGSISTAISHFHDVGVHEWTPGNWTASAPHRVTSGPNRGCRFLTRASTSFTSTPKINANLTNTGSAFSQAQDKAYLTSPGPVRVIPRNLYSVGAGGTITETPAGSVGAHFNISGSYTMSPHCIDQPTLLSGTRRHEFEDPAPDEKSHKGNCLKALRALEPVKYAEALVQVPSAQLNFSQLFRDRITAVANVAATHDIVDEAQTAANHSVTLVSGQSIIDVNADSSGNLIGPVWNPTTNAQLTN